MRPIFPNRLTICRSDMNQLQTIQQILSDTGNQIFFDTPVIVRKHHVSILECWGVNIERGLWLMDETGNWHEWDSKDLNAGLVLNSIYQRVRSLQLKVA
jgi:hypothetical protein